ncbi:MAG TPA: metalloregulator ArsR/SmtB family transcription factor [Anaeromyxobacteraceae bacterium]|nr:metalloregulator ArsR/SmtB family transcription factor [Anaeromyxobacteraceae bacterium]
MDRPRGVDALLAVLGSLADPTRLRLLVLLERHELGVVELCDVLRLPQSSVSRHLKVLAEEGWLASRREGTAHLYCMADGLAPASRRLWKVARAETEGWSTVEHDALRLARRLATRREEADAFFAGAAGEWERLRAELYGRAFAEEAMLAVLPRGLVVADLGCGTGDLAARLAPHVGRVLAVDRSAAMLRSARRRLEGLANVELHRADLEALPIEDGACDAALLVLALSYVAEPEPVLAEAARVVRPGGAVAVLDLSQHGDEAFRRRMGQATLGFEPAALSALLARAGLAAASCRPLPPEAGARGPALLVARAEKPA